MKSKYGGAGCGQEILRYQHALTEASNRRGDIHAHGIGRVALFAVVVSAACVSAMGFLAFVTPGATPALKASVITSSDSECSMAKTTSRSMVVGASVAMDMSRLMPLRATLHYTMSGALLQYSKKALVTAKYSPRGSTLSSLWTEKLMIEMTTPLETTIGELEMYRLRPKTVYDYTIYVQVLGDEYATMEYAGDFTSGGTGFPRFDEAPYLHLGGSNPSFEMATFAVSPGIVVNGSGLAGGTMSFEGIVAVDAEGWVVWYYHTCSPVAWDFTPGENVAIINSAASCTDQGREYSRNGSVYTENSQFQIVDVHGLMQSQTKMACSGAPVNYNALAAECRVDHSSPLHARDLLTTTYDVVKIPNITVLARSAPNETAITKHDIFAMSKISRYNSETSSIEDIYEMSNFLEPESYMPASAGWKTITNVACSGGASANPIDYHQISSVSPGAFSNYIVASKSLDAVFSLAHDGSGKQWTLSPDETISDFTFVSDADKFFSPLDVTQLPNGNILMIDGGSNRPGCTLSTQRGCFSRAIMYKLDPLASIVSVAWQFEFPFGLQNPSSHLESKADVWKHAMTHDAFSVDGGSARKLSNGRFLLAFPSLEKTRDWDPSGAGYAYEVDMDAHDVIVSKLTFPTDEGLSFAEGNFRLVPWGQVHRESSTCPFSVEEDSLQGRPTAGP